MQDSLVKCVSLRWRTTGPGFQRHVVLGVCLLVQKPALGSAGFNQHHHLPLLWVIDAQWPPSGMLPSTFAAQHLSPQHGAICIYIVSLAHTPVRRYMCASTVTTFTHPLAQNRPSNLTAWLKFQCIFNLKVNSYYSLVLFL